MATTTPPNPVKDGPISVPQVIDQIWQYISSQVSSRAVNDILLPATFKDIIGQQGLMIIATRFRYIDFYTHSFQSIYIVRNLIQGAVTICEDPKAGIIRIIPVRDPEGKPILQDAPEPQTPATKKAEKVKVPRPPNAFILYRQHHHPLVKEKNPELRNNQICKFLLIVLFLLTNLWLAVILGSQWKEEDQTTRDHFKAMAQAIKKKHQRDHPEYSYQPRKPTERKRRMTRKKAAVLSELTSALYTASTSTPTPVTTESMESILTRRIIPAAKVSPAYTREDFLKEMPKLERSPTGLPTFVVGDRNLPSNKLRFMLEAHNKTIDMSDPLHADATQWAPIYCVEKSDDVRCQEDSMWSIFDWANIDRQTAFETEKLETIVAVEAEYCSRQDLKARTNQYNVDTDWLTENTTADPTALFE